MDISSLVLQAIDTTDTLAQVAVSLYIAIAVFSGEQVATALKGQRPQIRINPRLYIEYLNIKQASIALLALIAIKPLYDTNIFPDITLAAPKMLLGILALVAVLGYLFFIISDTLIHRSIEKKFEHITGSTSRLIAWALQQEVTTSKRGAEKVKGKIEQLKLITTLLEHENDVNLEQYMLKLLTERVNDIVSNPKANQKITPSLLGTLRSLNDNFDKRPVHDIQYYELLFQLSHVTWHKAFTEREELHKQQIFQISGALGRIARKLLVESIADQTLGYDYATNATQFLKDDVQRARDYRRVIAHDIYEQISKSPHAEFADDPYMIGLREQLQKITTKKSK